MVFSRSLLRRSMYPAPRANINFDSFKFALNTKDSMMVSARHVDKKWSDLQVIPFGPISLEPGATILNYGQGIFEGLKAYRTSKGRIVLFRPDRNFARINQGARRLAMPEIPEDLFFEGLRESVVKNGDLVPECNKGAFYLRPLLFGSGSHLGVSPSTEYDFLIYGSPVGEYFTAPHGAHLKIVRDHQRAATRGTGNIKCGGNYAPCFQIQGVAKKEKYSDVLYLNADGTHVEEVAASNFFLVTRDAIYTTPIDGTILPGVTRESVIELLGAYKDEFKREVVFGTPVDKIWNAEEAFCTGTAAGVTAISKIVDPETKKKGEFPPMGPVSKRLKELLFGIMHEEIENNKFNWLHDPFSV